jgi:hypothetical protein
LDASISLSLSSPRITSDSKELLSLLSILPDGLSDIELVQSNLPIPNILGCKAALLATSLAYQDDKKRLRSLVPIREHIQQFSPPSPLPHTLPSPVFLFTFGFIPEIQGGAAAARCPSNNLESKKSARSFATGVT